MAGPQTRGMQKSLIDVQLSLTTVFKRALKQALRSVVLRKARGPWRVVVRPTLVYEIPSSGRWWWSVALTSGTGMRQLLLVPPEDQNAEAVADLVAIRRELTTSICSRCGRIQLKNGRWHRRELPKPLAGTKHVICPVCASHPQPPLM